MKPELDRTISLVLVCSNDCWLQRPRGQRHAPQSLTSPFLDVPQSSVTMRLGQHQSEGVAILGRVYACWRRDLGGGNTMGSIEPNHELSRKQVRLSWLWKRLVKVHLYRSFSLNICERRKLHVTQGSCSEVSLAGVAGKSPQAGIELSRRPETDNDWILISN